MRIRSPRLEALSMASPIYVSRRIASAITVGSRVTHSRKILRCQDTHDIRTRNLIGGMELTQRV